MICSEKGYNHKEHSMTPQKAAILFFGFKISLGVQKHSELVGLTQTGFDHPTPFESADYFDSISSRENSYPPHPHLQNAIAVPSENRR